MQPEVYRAPMRSRIDAVDAEDAVERALDLGVVGVGGRLVSPPVDLADALTRVADEHDERTAARLERFTRVPDGATVWTRHPDGRYLAGEVLGPWRYDGTDAAWEVDLTHVRPCAWAEPVVEHRTPPAVVATYRRGGRNFQRIRA